MQVVFERTIAATPEAVWEWLTVPERMCEWSTAPVSVGSAGDDPDAPGFERIVTMRSMGVPARLAEQVVTVERPHRYGYTVAPNPFIRRHRAEQRLELLADGSTRLTWTVDLDAWIPGLMRLFVRVTRPHLERSLDALVACVTSDSVA